MRAASAPALWCASGRTEDEFNQIMMVVAEQAFIERVWPTPVQIAQWKVTGQRRLGVQQHVLALTGVTLTMQTATRLWRFFSEQPQPRRRCTTTQFLRGLYGPLRCRVCGGTSGPFHIDHIIALRKGGDDSLSNLRILCQTCNLRKGARLDPTVVYIEVEESQGDD